MSLIEDTIALFADEVVAQYAAGGLEPDGVGLSFGVQVANEPGVLGFGTDLRCRTDVTANMDEVDPNSPEAVADALVRRLSTPNGQILNDPEALIAVGEDPNYGFNLLHTLSVGSTDVEIAAYSDLASAECRKDDRVATCTVTVVQSGPLNEFAAHLEGDLKSGQRYKAIMPLVNAQAVIDEESR